MRAWLIAALLWTSALGTPRAFAQTAVTVAISYFDNNTGKAELEPLAKGMADMLITDLSQVQSLRVVERQKLNQVLAELQLSKSRFIDPTTAQKLGKGLAAKYILSGSYALVGDTLRIDARVFNVQTGAVLTSKKVEGKKDDFFALEKDVADLLIAALAVKLAPEERSSLRRNPTQSYDAWSAYANGLDAQDKGDVARARAAFQQALAADPNYRAARTASERLAAVFAQSAAQTEGQFDATFRDLDPKAANFNQRVDALLQSLADAKGPQYERKLSLLTWLARGGQLACTQTSGPAVGRVDVLIGGVPQGGVVSHCPQVQAVLMVANRLLDDPTQWDAIAKTCEHFIARLPGDKAALAYCEMLMSSFNSKKVEGAAVVSQELAEDDARILKGSAPDDWRRTLIEKRPAMRGLLQVYARQVK